MHSEGKINLTEKLFGNMDSCTVISMTGARHNMLVHKIFLCILCTATVLVSACLTLI